MTLFEKATKAKFRFDTVKGLVSTEDLWDIPLSSRNGFDLDAIAIQLDKKITEAPKTSFVKTVTTANQELLDKLEVVKHIIDYKLKDAEAKELSMARQSKKAFLQDVIAKKQVEAYDGKTLEELQAELESL